MHKELELWRFVADRLQVGQRVVLLVVATSSGSSPGRAGHKMAVAEDGEMTGSIGGGVMEVNLVEEAKAEFAKSWNASDQRSRLRIQEHRKQSNHPSGMICSGQQTIIFTRLNGSDRGAVSTIISDIEIGDGPWISITENGLRTWPDASEPQNRPLPFFETLEAVFTYTDKLDRKNELVIVGGGHCALALSELMSKLDFRIRIFDDRPDLNTIDKNKFVDALVILNEYTNMSGYFGPDNDAYVVVMTLGYKTDAIVIRQLLDKDFKYFGVLGSKAKMATLFRELFDEGYSRERLDRIRTPIGIPINSHSPEEIAVSIAAEIISVKNAA